VSARENPRIFFAPSLDKNNRRSYLFLIY